MAYMLAIAVVTMAIAVIVKSIGDDRYAKMSEAEFEAEAKRGSAIGSAMLAVQNILEPQRKVEYVLRRDKQAEGDSSESGDSPDSGPAPKT